MTSPLRQQEIVDPAPLETILVPEDADGYWGVDPSTRRLAIAWTTSTGRGVVMTQFPALTGGERLQEIYARSRVLCVEAGCAGAPKPGVVVIESPGGKTFNPDLMYAVGAIMAGIYAATRARQEMMAPSRWKRRACGRGDIWKPKRADSAPGTWPEYGVLTWARLNGYGGASWDEADAWGIAEAARRTYRLEAR